MTRTRYLWVLVLAAAWLTPASAMSRATAISAGSFFAAATRCETEGLISAGQTAPLMQALNQYLSAADQANLRSGYARGTRDAAVFVVQKNRWSAFAPAEASCYRVQSVLDDYKAQIEPE